MMAFTDPPTAEGRLGNDVQRVWEHLKGLPDPVVRPSLVLLAGLPGTGKTSFARRLVKRVRLVVVESDAVRRLLFPRPTYAFWESNWVFRVCYRVVEELLAQGISVLFDATNLADRYREPVYRIADRVGAKLIIVHLMAPAEVVRDRLAIRAASPPPGELSEATWEVYERMAPQWQPISRPHFVVDTAEDMEPAVVRIAREVVRQDGG